MNAPEDQTATTQRAPGHAKTVGPVSVAVLLLNYQHATDTVQCLKSLQALEPSPNYQVSFWVVDNASGDGSTQAIQAAFPQVHLIEAPQNLGFSGGNNLGFQAILDQGDIDYVWLLNNDTQVVSDTLTHLLQTAQSYPGDLIGPTILYPDGRFQRLGSYLTPWTGSVKHYKAGRLTDGQVVESLSGCSMLIPTTVLQSVGLWDPTYFLYLEDVAYCWACAQQNIRCRVSLKAQVIHQEGATTGQYPARVTYYYQRNRLMLLKQLTPPWRWPFIMAYTRWRLVRSTIKLALKQRLGNQAHNADTLDALKAHHQAFVWAVDDFNHGVVGVCPHPL